MILHDKISTVNCREQLKSQLNMIDTMIAEAERRLASNKTTESRSLHSSRYRKGFQYYLKDSEGKRTYVRAADLGIVQGIAQREYDASVKKKLLELKKRIERFLWHYGFEEILLEYNRLPEAKRVLIQPLVIPDEEFIELWEKEFEGEMNTYPEKGKYPTNKGEEVRSKSEKILADLFYKYNIPYVYEPRLTFRDGSSVYPDFALLNVKERRTIYWEHFGLADDDEYAGKALQKLERYEINGIITGIDLIFSTETGERPLDVKRIEKKIRQHLL